MKILLNKSSCRVNGTDVFLKVKIPKTSLETTVLWHSTSSRSSTIMVYMRSSHLLYVNVGDTLRCDSCSDQIKVELLDFTYNIIHILYANLVVLVVKHFFTCLCTEQTHTSFSLHIYYNSYRYQLIHLQSPRRITVNSQVVFYLLSDKY